ncbi:MAG: YhcH/YjgK/YiaL family protein [Rikenellaceae bacterium]|nr:YhcH/YjgK/YiaL family protein [Rikenellaceae bacterium]
MENSGQYEPLHHLFRHPFGILRELRIFRICPRADIPSTEKNCWLAISADPLRPPSDAPLEVHDKYIDIQSIIEGVETFGWAPGRNAEGPRASGCAKGYPTVRYAA